MSSAAGVVDLVDLDADGDSEEDEDENGCAGSVLGLSPKPAIKSKKGPEAAARQAGMVRKGLDLALSSSSEDEDNDDDEEEDDNDNDDIVRLGYTASQSKIENEADEEENERDEEDEESIQVLHAAASKLTTYAESLSSPTLLRGEAEVISLVTTEKKKTISRMATSPVSVLSVSPVVSPTRKRGRSTTDTLDDEDRGQSTARRFEQMPRAKLSSTVSFATSTFTSTVTSSTSSSSSSSSSLLSSPVLYNGAQTYGAGPQHAPAPPALKPEISEMNLEGLTKAEAREAMRKAKAEEKAKKKRHQAECKLGRWIKNGKHAQIEVVAVFSPRFAQTDQGRALQGMCIAEDIDFVVESGFRSSCMVTFANRPFLKSTDNPDSAGFQLKNGITTKPEPVVDAKATPCLMSNAALLFWDADDFVMRLCRDLEGYASLEVVISSALADWTSIVTSGRPRSKFTKDQPKLIIVLRGANEAVLSAQKRARAQKKTSQESADQLVNPDRTTQSALTDALSWLYVAYGCESRVLLNDQDKTNELFRDYAFAIMSALHYRPKTAVEVLAEFKGAGGRNADWGTNCERGEYVSHMWYLMLLCVLGDVGARRVLEEYPCLRSITDVYLDSTRHEHEKEQLLEDILSGSSSSAKFRKKSRALYRLFTTRDPHLLLK